MKKRGLLISLIVFIVLFSLLSAVDVQITFPSNNTYWRTNTLNINYTKGNDAQACWYSNDTYSINNTLTGCVNITNIIWSEGQHNVTIWVNDSSNNINISYVTFTIDTINPDINFTFPTPANNTFQSTNSVYVNVSTYDANNHSAFIDWNRTLRGWWNFGSVLSNGTVYDNSSYGNHGRMIGFTLNTTVAGIRGQALNFDGINDFVSFNYNQNFNITNNMTVEGWFYHADSLSFNPIVSRDDATRRSWTVRTINYNNLSFSVWNRTSVVVAGKLITDPVNTWHYFAAVYNSTAVIIYVDGVPGVPVDFSGDINDTNMPLRIGLGAGGYPYWNGSIDEIKIYSRALSLEEVRSSYNAGTYRLYNNFTNLSDATYTYKAYAIDVAGNVNVTEERTITVDSFPDINFTFPTPANNTFQSTNSVYVNVSTYDANNHSAFIDWNRTLRGWWAMDFYNSSGIYDNSTYENFGTFKGDLSASRLVNARRGKGLEFDGGGDYLQIANEGNFDFTNNFTIEAWVKPIGSDTYNAIITKFAATSGWDWILNIGTIRMTARGTSTIDTGGQGGNLRDGNWHHIVAVITPSGIQQYVDGSPLTFVSGTWTPTTNDIVPSIGYRSGITGFNGTMDEVKIYNRALSLEEVRASYNAGTYKLYHNFTNIPDDTYTYKAYAIDPAGNVNATEERTIAIDTINPSITIIFPQNNSNWSINTVDVNYTISDENLAFCWYSNDTYLVNTTLADCGNITDVVWSEGQHNVTVWINDTAGNINISYVTFTVDTINPTISITYPTNNTAYSNINLDVNYTVSDSGIGVESCWYSNDSYTVNTSLADCGTNITTITWSEEGHNVTIWVNDSVGNTNVSYVTFTIDTVNPDINFTSPTPENDSRQPTNSVYVNVSTYDANNHSAFIDWNRTLRGWWAMDFYNSGGIYDNSTYENFGTFVGLSVSRISGAVRGEGLEFDGSGDYLRVSNEENFDFTSNFTIEAWIKPRGTDTYNAIMGKYLLTPLSGWDWILDVGRVRMSVRGTNSIASAPQGNDLRDGNWHHIAAVITNRSIQQYVDGVPLTKVMGNWTPLANNINLTIGYRDSGMTGFNGSIDEVKIYSRALSLEEVRASYNAGLYNLYKNFTNLSDATYTYKAYAIDAAGNVNVTEERTITVDIPSPPNVILNSPGDGIQSGNETQIFNCSAADVNYNTQLSNVTFYWDYSGVFAANATIAINDESATLNFTMAGLTDTTLIWNCYACDNLSNCAFGASNYTLTIDTTIPVINVTNVTVSTTNAVINWTTNKNANSLIFYGINSNNLSLNVTNSSFSTNHTIIVTNLLPSITYYYNISSCDDANHCNTSGTYNFTTNATRIYYVDATNGLDTNNGTPQSSAWKTISKVNSENFNPGDSVMFKRNETWREQLIIPSSGSAGSPIIFADYGTGGKPIINPTANLSNWSVYSGNIYVANATGDITQVFVDGVFYNLSFHPNTGLFDTENHDGKYGLIDVNLTLTEDQMVNSTVKVMTANWIIEEKVVSQYNETIKTMNWTSPTAYDIRDRYGYYLENKLWMLDSSGEWWYNSSSSQIYIWLYGDENPNSHTVEVPNQTQAIYAENKAYIHVANLTIKQTKNNSLYFEDVDYSKLSNLDINDSGERFIYIHNSRNITLENINAYRARRDGFVLYQSENMTIINNSLYRLGTVGNPVRSYAGIWLEWVNNTLFQYNYLYDMGYIGIRVEGKENILNKNIVNRTCVNLDDCAGIYSQLSNVFINTFSNNIIVDSIGSPPMKNASLGNEAAGIYLDDSSSEFLIVNNTIINADRGIFVHNSFNNTIVNNTVYNARTGAIYLREDSAVGIHNNNISGNIFYTNSTTLPTATFLGLLNSTDFGSFDYNYYSHPYFDELAIRFYNGTTKWTYFHYYPLYLWKQEKGNDNHSYDMDDFYKINDSNLGSSNYGTEKIINTNFSSSISGWAQYPATYEKSWVSDCPIGNDGCLLVVHNDSDSTTHSIYSASFPLVGGQEYEVRFKIRGNSTFSVVPEITRNAVPYDNLGYINYRLVLSNETQEVFKIFTATESTTGRFSISFYANATQFWIDDVHVREVNNVRYNNKSDDFLFLYNTETTSQIYKLNKDYMNLHGNTVSNSITLEPYSSVLLLAGYCNYDYTCNNLETSSTCPSDCGAAAEETEVTPEAGGGGCDYDWICSEWYPSPCPSEGIQKRVCVNRGECAGTFGMPVLNRTCVPYLIEPAEPLFDIFLNIPTKSKWILKGDNVSFDVRLLNVGNKTTIDVSFEYLIADENKKLIAEKKETRAVGEEDEFGIEIPLPENLQEGVYKIYVQIIYDDGKVATAGDSFEIVKDTYTIFLRRAMALLPALSIPLLVILVLVLLLILVRRSHQFKHLKRKHKEKKREKREKKIKKKKKKGYAKKYKKEKRKAEREIRKAKRKTFKVKHKEKRKIKSKAKKGKKKIEVLKSSLSEEFIEKRKILERKHRQRKIKELKKEIKQRK